MKFIKALLIVSFLLCLPSAVFAQDAEYRLDVNRDFGYGAGSNIRGSFSNRIYGPEENIASVTYLIDGEEMAVVDEPPFTFKYHTDDYPNGWHDMTAVVTTKDGRQVETPPVRVNMLSAASEGESMRGIFIPLLIIIGAVSAIGLTAQFLMMRRGGGAKPGAPRQYGFKGGTICPRCGRAYPIHFMSINLIGGVIDRCDYCGKVAFVQRKSQAELEAAERLERASLSESEYSLPGAQTDQSDEERARKLLDDSRYTE
jgi:hypothetical protein